MNVTVKHVYSGNINMWIWWIINSWRVTFIFQCYTRVQICHSLIWIGEKKVESMSCPSIHSLSHPSSASLSFLFPWVSVCTNRSAGSGLNNILSMGNYWWQINLDRILLDTNSDPRIQKNWIWIPRILG